jgi:transposase
MYVTVGYKVAHPLIVKVIAYAKVKTDKVDATILADLLRTDMIFQTKR